MRAGCFVAVLVAALAGCAAEAPQTEPAALEAAPAVEEAAPEPAPACDLTFSVDPELAAPFAAAAERWSAATGCDVHLGDGGIPVRIVARDSADLFNAQANRYEPGVTVIDGAGIRISLAPDWQTRAHLAPIHEMGHALSKRTGHCDDPAAVMYWNPKQGAITASDLVYVCALLPCQAFVPEA